MKAERNFYAKLEDKFVFHDSVKRRFKTLAGLSVLSTVAVFGCFLLNVKIHRFAAIACAFGLWSFALFCLAASKEYTFTSPLNPFLSSAAVGFAMAAFYNCKGFDPSVKILGMVAGGYLAANLISWAGATLTPFIKSLSLVNVLAAVGTGVYSALNLVNYPELFSVVLFLSIFYLGAAAGFAVYMFIAQNEFWKYIQIGYTLSAIIIIIIVLAIIFGGLRDRRF